MDGSLDAPPIIIRSRPTYAMWLFLGSAAFCAVIGGLGHGSTWDVMSFWLFAFCAFMALLILIVPPRLEIGPEALVQVNLGIRRRILWSEIHGFRPVVSRGLREVVGYDRIDTSSRTAALSGMLRAVNGASGVLMGGWELNTQALTDLLNSAHAKWRSQAVVSAPAEAPPPLAALPLPLMAGAWNGRRMNRKAYWIATLALAVLVLILNRGVTDIHASPAKGIEVFSLFVGAMRLHDLGLSGWWQAPVIIVLAVVAVFVPPLLGFPRGVSLPLVGLLSLLWTVALGSIPGSKTANRYGSPPGALLWPEEVF
jgi:uncharacterized membrane protein YhaH (DUF805 family)